MKFVLTGLFIVSGFLWAAEAPQGYAQWPGYHNLYYKKGVNAVYAKNLEGKIAAVQFAGPPLGFTCEGNVEIAPESLSEVADLYLDWVYSPNPPPDSIIEKVKRSVAYANGATPEPAIESPQRRVDIPENTGVGPDSTPASVTIYGTRHVSGALYDALTNVKAVKQAFTDSSKQPAFRFIKEIRADNFHLKVWIEHRVGEIFYLSEIKTWNNPHSMDGKYRDVIEGSGSFAQQLLAGLRATTPDTYGVRQWPLGEGQGVEDDHDDLDIRIRTYQGQVFVSIASTRGDLPNGADYLGEPVPGLMLTKEMTDFTGRFVGPDFNPGPYGWAPRRR